jgi:N-acetylglucosaminyl-diphospho-decaprenol L-rhamnosyltransferase
LSPHTEEQAPRQPARVSVVIVALNRAALLAKSLDLLGAAHQVVVVDNGSTDSSGERATLRLPRNFGLTRALNIGLRAAEGEYLMVLHDDACISAESVTKLADYLEAHPEVGIVAPLLTDASGKPAPQVSALPSPADPDPAVLPASGGDEITVPCVSGAAFMFRAFAFRSLRQIEERYGTYGSNLELCAQMARASKKIVVLRAVTAIHESAPSSVPASTLQSDRIAGTIAFLGKHRGFTSGIAYRLKAGPRGLVAKIIDGN